jgi:hypothetical protein
VATIGQLAGSLAGMSPAPPWLPRCSRSALGFWKAIRDVFPAPRPCWRAVNGPQLVALVRAGARFESGQLVERPDESAGDQQAA